MKVPSQPLARMYEQVLVKHYKADKTNHREQKE